MYEEPTSLGLFVARKGETNKEVRNGIGNISRRRSFDVRVSHHHRPRSQAPVDDILSRVLFVQQSRCCMNVLELDVSFSLCVFLCLRNSKRKYTGILSQKNFTEKSLKMVMEMAEI